MHYKRHKLSKDEKSLMPALVYYVQITQTREGDPPDRCPHRTTCVGLEERDSHQALSGQMLMLISILLSICHIWILQSICHIWDPFRIAPYIVSKLLRAAILSRCAVRFESEQTPFTRTGRRFRPAALHRIRFGTCCFVPCHIVTRRPLTDRKIERSDGRGFGRQPKQNLSQAK